MWVHGINFISRGNSDFLPLSRNSIEFWNLYFSLNRDLLTIRSNLFLCSLIQKLRDTSGYSNYAWFSLLFREGTELQIIWCKATLGEVGCGRSLTLSLIATLHNNGLEFMICRIKQDNKTENTDIRRDKYVNEI